MLTYAAFGVGFEQYTDGWTDSNGTPPGFGHNWAGFQGSLSGSLPEGSARWSGLMLGYQGAHEAGENPFVEGLATVKLSLSDKQVDVLFSEVTSRDGQRTLADFGFEGLQPQVDGTFGGYQSGPIEGTIFGPSHEETAGWFHHNPTYVTGSFGARRMPNTVTLEERGGFRRLEGSNSTEFYAYDEWGFWGKQFQEHLFGAFIEQSVADLGRTQTYFSPRGRIDGTPSGHNPVSGTAVWLGEVRAFETHQDRTPVSGNARLEVDFRYATVDVEFADFSAGHGDVSWHSLRLRDGAFRDTQGQATIRGRVLRDRASGRGWQVPA